MKIGRDSRFEEADRRLCDEFSFSAAEERLTSILKLDDRPLSEPRSADRRSVGCCRDYALMLVSILRHRGIPAHVRMGVALYFVSSEGTLIEDHYMTEHWNPEEERWQLTDPQIDDVQRPTKGLIRSIFLTGSSSRGGSFSKACATDGSPRRSGSLLGTRGSRKAATRCSPTSSALQATSFRYTPGGASASLPVSRPEMTI